MEKIVKRGLEIFKLRTEPMQVEHLGLPPIYGLFMKLYDLRSEGLLNPVVAWISEAVRYNVVDILYLPDSDNIMYGQFFSFEEAEEATKYAFSEEQRAFLDGKYRLIGEDGSGHYLFYVGIDPASNLDQIFVDTEVFDGIVEELPRLTKIADNMFEFMNGFAMVEYENISNWGFTYDRLYKNWGEKFWRVREEPLKQDQ